MTSIETPPPQAVVMQLMMGAWVSQAAGTLARLRIFDHVAPGGTSPAAIAERLGLSTDALARLMRAGAMFGVFREVAPRRYELTPVGELLRSDHPRSMRALLDVETAPGHWLPWGHLDACVRAGASPIGEVLGTDLFDYYAKHPAEGRAFSEGMTGLSMAALGAVREAWTPPAAKVVIDVGGAHGAFLEVVLAMLPEARGVLFDLPHIVETAPARPRTERIGGDFMGSVPPDGDLYLLKHIVHDWDDATVIALLSRVRAAMAKDATVVIVEMLIPDDGKPSPAILLDLNMMVITSGRERTASEIGELLGAAGLAITRVVPTHSPFGVIEARAR